MASRVWTTLLVLISLVSHAAGHPGAIDQIPAPAGASTELQEIIRNAPQRELSAAPASRAEWKNWIGRADENGAERTREAIDRLGVQLVTDKLNGVAIHHLQPNSVAGNFADRLFLYMHGGAYVFGSGIAGLSEAALIASRIGIPVLSVDYRMPPDDPFPAALDDVVAVYLDLLKRRSPKSIVIGGTSAGGGLALAVVHQLRRLGIPLPGAVYAGTPWADLTKTGDTLYTIEGMDRILFTYDGILGAAALLYAGEYELTDPLISPVYGEFQGFPPTILVTGTRDLFLSDTVRTHRKLREAGAVADLHVFEGMSHAGYSVSPETPESVAVYHELQTFIDTHLE